MPPVIVIAAAASGASAALGAATAAIIGATVSTAVATAIGSGIIAGAITLAQGGSASDALKSAVIGGVSSGIGASIGATVGSAASSAAASAGYSSIAEGFGQVIGGAASGATTAATAAYMGGSSGKDAIKAGLEGAVIGGAGAGIQLAADKYLPASWTGKAPPPGDAPNTIGPEGFHPTTDVASANLSTSRAPGDIADMYSMDPMTYNTAQASQAPLTNPNSSVLMSGQTNTTPVGYIAPKVYTPLAQLASGPAAPAAAPTSPGWAQMAIDSVTNPLAVGALVLSTRSSSLADQQKQQDQQNQQNQQNEQQAAIKQQFNEPLPIYTMNREYIDPNLDWQRYGRDTGQNQFFSNADYSKQAKRGGLMHFADGGYAEHPQYDEYGRRKFAKAGEVKEGYKLYSPKRSGFAGILGLNESSLSNLSAEDRAYVKQQHKEYIDSKSAGKSKLWQALFNPFARDDYYWVKDPAYNPNSGASSTASTVVDGSNKIVPVGAVGELATRQVRMPTDVDFLQYARQYKQPSFFTDIPQQGDLKASQNPRSALQSVYDTASRGFLQGIAPTGSMEQVANSPILSTPTADQTNPASFLSTITPPTQMPQYAMGGQVMPTNPSYYTYGQVPQYSNSMPMKRGGLSSVKMNESGRPISDGRTDDIPAMLSDGEYVIDAETVALLGNGSQDAGAKQLDRMRQQVRKQKGGALSKGQISPNARSPLAYLKQRMA